MQAVGRTERVGIATAGNWIVDYVKLIGHYPDEDTLVIIDDERRGGGGGAHNCIIDLANLGVDVPLSGIGVIGDDENGRWLRDRLTEAEVDQSRIVASPTQPTSYTDVMTVTGSGRRTFFHRVGASAEFTHDSFPFDGLHARVLHLAYLLVLPGLDAPDPEFGCVGARVLHRLSEDGLLTSLDIVSEDSPRAREVVLPALPHVDSLCINEFEAGLLTETPVRDGDRLRPDGVRQAARKLLEHGVRRQVVIHMPEGGYALLADGDELFTPSLDLPPGFVAGSNGAGDAFGAGVLYGLHEAWPLDRTLDLAVATAAACLRDPTTTAGVGTLAETLGLLEAYPRQAVAF